MPTKLFSKAPRALRRWTPKSLISQNTILSFKSLPRPRKSNISKRGPPKDPSDDSSFLKATISTILATEIENWDEPQVDKVREASQALGQEIKGWYTKQQTRALELHKQGYNGQQVIEAVRTTKMGVEVEFYAATFAMDSFLRRMRAKSKGDGKDRGD
jgi:hypothetical protein